MCGLATILLVDDDKLVRRSVARLLHRNGYRVVEVATCAEARATLEDRSQNHVDLLLTDLRLPDGNGVDLAAWTRTTRPGVAVILLTGAPEDALDRIGSQTTPLVIAKPFRNKELIEAVATTLPNIGRHAAS